jgi:hypothetical protein
LALGPSSQVTSWQAYDINGYTFYTKAKDQKSMCQNSGVRIENVSAFGEVHTQFGFIEEIWELEYGSDIHITMFRCRWVKHPSGVEVNKFELTRVNVDNVGYKDHTWVPANCVARVLYYADPKNPKRHVAISGKQRILGVDGVEDLEEHNDYCEMQLFTDLPKKIRAIEAHLEKSNIVPYLRTDMPGKIVTT